MPWEPSGGQLCAVPGESRDEEDTPKDDPPERLPPVREEFPTAVYDELRSLKGEISDLRNQVEFVP